MASEPSSPAPQPVPDTGAEPVSRHEAASATRRPTLKSVWHRAVARRAPDVQRCADQASGSRERLAVAVNIDTAGRVLAHVEGAPDTPLSRCLNAVFKNVISTAPREPTSLVHVFELRVASDP